MPKVEKGKAAPLPVTGKRTQVVDHAAKIPFWKPSHVNDKLYGKLVRIASGQEGRQSLVLITAGGPMCVGINFALINVEWERYIGAMVELIFTGEVGKRHGRTYDAFVTEAEEAQF